jgi:hypothetical protein
MTKYKIHLIFENTALSGGNNKLIAVKEGSNIYEYISKWDRVLNDVFGEIQMCGPSELLKEFFVLEDDYDVGEIS